MELSSAVEIVLCSHFSVSCLLSHILTQPMLSPLEFQDQRIGLKEQKKKSSKFLLTPIDASRQILNSAYLSLSKIHSLLSTFLVYLFNEFN
ncbi:hypothetical protein Patl1_09142 [Pistacia atlantica]|uniref:Uncharacterized protein n=1 Tax=Pistacia atlantica TaxID=434234 RepID=A0ACC1AEN0_9ROSI|nr:hypothetical protein Patl1_09142 [Pistacia atlantica]